jgi:hypothetical protein
MVKHPSASVSRKSRTRAAYAALALGTIGIGLLVHFRCKALAPTVRDVLGDALWAAMIVWWASAAAPGARPWVRYMGVYLLCVLVEVSQRYHEPTLDAVRATRLGHLVLGNGFDSRDLLAYGLGVCVAALVDATLVARRGRQRAAI